MTHQPALQAEPVQPNRRPFRSDTGAIGTEMAIVVAIVVAIALGIGAAMRNSASNFEDCIPDGPDAVPCDFAELPD